MQQPLEKFFKSKLTKNIGSLYGTQILRFIIPLLTVPYLARILGPKEWGMVSYYQSLGMYLWLLSDYGFQISGSREIAKNRENVVELGKVVSGIIGARFILSFIIIIGGIFIQILFPSSNQFSKIYLWSTIFWSLNQGNSLNWYFQGIENLSYYTFYEFIFRIFSTILVFIFIKTPSDGMWVLFIQGLGPFSLNLFLFLKISNFYSIRALSIHLMVKYLKLGFHIFFYRNVESVYQFGNSFFLGFFVTPNIVGYFAGAEKIIRALASLIEPISLGVFPRLNLLLKNNTSQAIRLTKISTFLTTSLGLSISFLSFIFAEGLIQLFLGNGYVEAIPIFRILSIIPLAVALKFAFGIQWMISLNLDRIFNKIISFSSIFYFILFPLLTYKFKEIGMAWTLSLTEVSVIILILFYLRKMNLNPFSKFLKIPPIHN